MQQVNVIFGPKKCRPADCLGNARKKMTSTEEGNSGLIYFAVLLSTQRNLFRTAVLAET
jgi:hypothetical protein